MKNLIIVLLLLGATANLSATSIEISDFDAGHTFLNFDELVDGQIVDNEYLGLGLLISGTLGNDGTGAASDITAEDTGGSYSDPIYLGQPNNSWNGSVIFEFTGLTVTQVGAIMVASSGTWLSVYDTSDNLIETVFGSGATYDFVGIDTGNVAIGRAIFSGNFYAIDDARFNNIPEPSTLMVFSLALLGLSYRKLKKC